MILYNLILRKNANLLLSRNTLRVVIILTLYEAINTLNKYSVNIRVTIYSNLI